MRRATATTLVLVALAAVLFAAAPAAARSGASVTSVGATSAGAVRVVGAVPAGGFDDFGCRPSAAHPQPVVLLHGLGGPPSANWAYIGPALARAGYCAFASPYSPPGSYVAYGLASVSDGAQQIATYIDRVLAATGASQVDLVGHSEGGFMSLYVPKVLGYGPKVHAVVAMAPPTHGTSFFGLVTLARATGFMPLATGFLDAFGCPACADMVVGGAAVQRLDDGPIAVPGVRYTILATRFDELVRNERYSPATDTAFVRELGVANRYVQDVCPADPVGHGGLAFDPDVLTMITNALDPDHPAPVTCSFGFPM